MDYTETHRKIAFAVAENGRVVKMNKYINTQTAIDLVKKHYSVDNDLLEIIVYEIENSEPEDVQPVRHGRWIHDGFDVPHGVDWMHCSECGKRDKYCPAAMTNYCSDCGAIMDGEQHEG